MSAGDWSVVVGVVMDGGEGKRGVGVGCVADVSRRSLGSGCGAMLVVVVCGDLVRELGGRGFVEIRGLRLLAGFVL